MDLFQRVIRRLIEELAKAILDPVKGPVAAAVLGLLPAVVVWVHRGIGFFHGSYPVPVWIMSSSLGLLIFGAYWIGRQQLQLRRFKRTLTRFESRGLEWLLTADFRANYQHLLLAQMSFQLLDGIVRGPFCMGCKRDASWVFELESKCA
jgi:hypothetical protein